MATNGNDLFLTSLILNNCKNRSSFLLSIELIIYLTFKLLASYSADIAKPAKELTPIHLIWQLEIVIPKAVEIIQRIPVKLPGPQPTAKKRISSKDMKLSFKNILIVGTIISDNSLLIGIDMWLKILFLFDKVSDKSEIEGYPNFSFYTDLPNQKLVKLDSGINPIGKVLNKIMKMKKIAIDMMYFIY